jgi:hypothetical protein
MAYALPSPVPLETYNRVQIESFSCEMQTLEFTLIIGRYLDQNRVRTKTIAVPQSALVSYMTRPLTGESMYAAMKRMLYEYLIATGEIPPGAVNEEAPAPPAPDPEPEPAPDPEPEPQA